MGTDSEPRSLRIEANGERLGTEWGLGPFTIEQTTEDVTAIHRLAASGLRGRGCLATGDRLGNPSGDPAGRPAPRSMTRAGRAIRSAPNPGTSWPEARSE